MPEELTGEDLQTWEILKEHGTKEDIYRFAYTIGARDQVEKCAKIDELLKN